MSQPQASRTRTLRTLLALLCIGLVLLAGGVHLLHDHATTGSSDPGCSLCTLSHVVALPGPVAGVPVVVEAVVDSPTEIVAAVPGRFFSFSLYVRPPPVDLTQL